MKKLIRVFSLVLALALTLALFACGGSECTSHVDVDKDAKCDTCGAAVACAKCVDDDGDGKCDVCKKDVEKAPCTSHVDVNKDAKCDTCGTAVACTECVDDDNDGKCDVCGGEVIATINDIVLIENGEAKFQFVLENGIATDVRKTVEQTVIKGMQRKSGIVVKSVTDGFSDDEEMEYEVLVGNVSGRGAKYTMDRHDLGKEGYIIKIIGTKIVINAGSDATLADAVEEFAKDILDYENKNLNDVVMTKDDVVIEYQDNYKITSLSVNGTNMKGYTIATDTSNEKYKSAALTLQDNIYSRVGYWLDIVPLSEATEKSVIIRNVPRVYTSDSFKVSADGSKLLIECAFDNKLNDTVAAFSTTTLTLGRGDINFEGTIFNRDISFVTYEDFGAKGDGRTDDFQALYLAHEFANESGQVVKATPGKTYYLKQSRFSLTGSDRDAAVYAITIKTNTIWDGASFTIDDSTLDYNNPEERGMTGTNVFEVTSDYERFDITDAETLAKVGSIGYSYGTTKIDLDLGYPALLVVYNKNHKVYRRSGSTYVNTTKGTNQSGEMHELILIDAEGNIDPSTPFMFDYKEVTSITVMRADDAPITIKGGNVTTIACGLDASETVLNASNKVSFPSHFGYYARGLNVSRSYTVVEGVKHFITGEVTVEQQAQGIEGVHYNGFLYGKNATDVKFLNCQVQGRRYYGVSGTYDLGANLVNNITFEGCNQINFWIDADGNVSNAENGDLSMRYNYFQYNGYDQKVRNCWGVGGTNYCKNMNYINSKLSRFDAHCGLYNGKVIGSDVTFLAITGKGDFIIEDVNWYSAATGATDNSLVYMRGDYGSTWEGNVVIKDVNAYASEGDFYMFYHGYNNWDYGYKCYIPNITVDNINIYNVTTKAPIDSMNINFFYGSKHPYMHLDTYQGSAPKVIIFSESGGECVSCVDEMIVNATTGAMSPGRDAKCDVCGVQGEYVLTTDSSGTWVLDHITDTYVQAPEADRIKNRNDNPIGMPDYIKITNISKDYTFQFARSDDPNFYFANTKFYYGTGDKDYYQGTNHDSDNHIIFA